MLSSDRLSTPHTDSHLDQAIHFSSTPIIKDKGFEDILSTWQAMQSFTQERKPDTPDEIWLLQHPPVFTLGLAGKMEHILNASDIPIVKLDRGGQVTYHGPGQLIVYLMLDLRKRQYGVKELVYRLEESVISLLKQYAVIANRKPDAPGVYVDGEKIASLGLRVKHGCCYHGIALNVAMDLVPFSWINPCGYPGLAVTQTSNLGIHDQPDVIKTRWLDQLLQTI